jgi:hypothetical protein
MAGGDVPLQSYVSASYRLLNMQVKHSLFGTAKSNRSFKLFPSVSVRSGKALEDLLAVVKSISWLG